jgi:hypothetical protein
MRATMQINFRQACPGHALKQLEVLRLHMGTKLRGAVGAGCADSGADQLCAQTGDAAKTTFYREARTLPVAGRGFVDADGADHVVWRAEHAGKGNDGDGVGVDVVLIIAGKNRLFGAKNVASQAKMSGDFPGLARVLDTEFAGDKAVGCVVS